MVDAWPAVTVTVSVVVERFPPTFVARIRYRPTGSVSRKSPCASVRVDPIARPRSVAMTVAPSTGPGGHGELAISGPGQRARSEPFR